MRFQRGRRVAAAAVGMLLLVGAAPAASAAPDEAPGAPMAAERAPASAGCTPLLRGSAAGAQAVRELGSDLPAVAARNGRSAAELREVLLADDSLHVDACGALAYVDEPLGGDASDLDATARTSAAARASAAAPAAEAPYPLDRTFALHSRPGASRTVFLDLDGDVLTGTPWNTSSAFAVPDGTVLPPFSLDADPAFSDQERAVIQSVWQHVAEDFAPFDVDVTTEDPGADALDRTDDADTTFGVRAVITNVDPAGTFCDGCSGIGWVGTFGLLGTSGAAYRHPSALVFATEVGRVGEPQLLADTTSHEVGHNFGLDHHGDLDQGPTEAHKLYALGQGLWSPLMGSGVYPLSTWSHGDYAGANRPEQDDVGTIATLAPLADDHDDATATALGDAPVDVEGVIGSRADVDRFTVTGHGTTTVTVTPAPVGPNLDLELEVRSEDGTVVATADPTSSWPFFDRFPYVDFGQPVSGLDAEVVDLPAGTYELRVAGVGAGDPAIDGYSDYGSLGRYTLNVTSDEVAPPPVPTPVPTPVVEITEAPSGTVATTAATVAFTADLDDADLSCRLDGGPWAACTSPWQLTDLAEGEHTVEVRASLDGATSDPVSRSWTVDTVAPSVTITAAPASGTTATDASFRFTAEPGAALDCRLDAGVWQACSSPHAYADLAVGDHTFTVRATDAVGNHATAEHGWTVSAPPPPPPPTTPEPPAPTPPTSPEPPAPTPTFADVDGGPHAAAVTELARRGVTLGCGGGRFCPDTPVTREQMATFLVRALELDAGSTSPPFSDVRAGSTHARSIDAMRREGITLGCGGGRFCPRTAVPREQMASFLTRALDYAPGSASPPFADVTRGSTHARSIDAVRREGVTLGCGGARFCPDASVTREQMASFLVRALGW